MTNRPDTKPTPVGVYGRSGGARITSVEVIAIVLTLVWIVGVGLFFRTLGRGADPVTDQLTTVMIIMALVLPVAMFWLAVVAARSTRAIREESQRMQAAVDAIRVSLPADRGAAPAAGGEDTITRKLDEIAAAQRKTETALATFHTSRSDPPKRPAVSSPLPVQDDEDQADLPLDVVGDDDGVALPHSTLIRALNFPETAEDEEGFAALRLALRDRVTANLVQAAQDVLTLLSQDGIYMDDLRPDMARPELWRRFAQGERGRVVAALGGIRDRSSLALTAGRMRQDPIFRDAAHHFLRRFDSMLHDFEPSATDQDITALSETRSARAFMLLGRVAGVFN